MIIERLGKVVLQIIPFLAGHVSHLLISEPGRGLERIMARWGRQSPHLWSAHCFMALGIREDMSWYSVWGEQGVEVGEQ